MTADQEHGPFYEAILPHLLPVLDPRPIEEEPTVPMADTPDAYLAAVQRRIDIAARGLGVLKSEDAVLIFDQYARRRTPDQCFKTLLIHLADMIAGLDLEPEEQDP